MICETCNEDTNIEDFKEGKRLFLECIWCRTKEELKDTDIRIIISKKNIVIERKV